MLRKWGADEERVFEQQATAALATGANVVGGMSHLSSARTAC